MNFRKVYKIKILYNLFMNLIFFKHLNAKALKFFALRIYIFIIIKNKERN
jgi:hypothetical protein